MQKRALTIILSVLLVLSTGLSPYQPLVFGQVNYDDAIQEKEKEKQNKQGELDESKERQFLYEQEGLTTLQRLTALQTDITNTQNEITAKENRLVELTTEVERKSAELADAKKKYDGTTLSLYKESRRTMVEIFFSSEGVEELLRQMGFRKFGIGFLLTKVRDFQSEYQSLADSYNELSRESSEMKALIAQLQEMTQILEKERQMYAQMIAQESSRQQQLVSEIANITAEQSQLIAQKMAASDTGTSVGEYEDSSEELPAPPFSPAFAVASVGIFHRLGLSQYGAYGRAKAGQTADQILMAYYNAQLVQNFPVPEQIYVSGHGWMPFEDQYLKGIAEMPASWAQSGGFEALKAQAIIARSYAIAFTNGGVNHICADQNCQVYYAPKVTDPSASEWHRAVAETRGQVLVNSAGNAISAFYVMTAGGYTRLPEDFDVFGKKGTNREYLKRIVDKAPDGKAYDGPGYGDCPWYHKVWYCDAANARSTGCVRDAHPWLSTEEMLDLLNASLLPEGYNSYLSNPSLGGWSYDQVRLTLTSLGVSPIGDISNLAIVNSNEGYTSTIVVYTSAGLREVGGKRFYDVYRLRSRGNLWLKSGLYDIVQR